MMGTVNPRPCHSTRMTRAKRSCGFLSIRSRRVLAANIDRRNMRHQNQTPDPEALATLLRYQWSIGIYSGPSPVILAPAPGVQNPVLRAADVTDVPAAFVADPFMIQGPDRWYMFFEIFNTQTFKGEIGLATSADARQWCYQQIVLDEPYHLSYPYVFAWQGEHYMVPETLAPKAVQLYRADTFPTSWSLLGKLVIGEFADPSLFRFADRWWLFVCSTPQQHDTLRLFFADQLTGPWQEHPASPIVEKNERTARPGGRVQVLPQSVIRYAQDCFPIYGTGVRAFEISELTPATYHEEECEPGPIVTATGVGWNAAGMHHLDPHRLADDKWIACVDGLCITPRIEGGSTR
jgi:hypothetical protein